MRPRTAWKARTLLRSTLVRESAVMAGEAEEAVVAAKFVVAAEVAAEEEEGELQKQQRPQPEPRRRHRPAGFLVTTRPMRRTRKWLRRQMSH